MNSSPSIGGGSDSLTPSLVDQKTHSVSVSVSKDTLQASKHLAELIHRTFQDQPPELEGIRQKYTADIDQQREVCRRISDVMQEVLNLQGEEGEGEGIQLNEEAMACLNDNLDTLLEGLDELNPALESEIRKSFVSGDYGRIGGSLEKLMDWALEKELIAGPKFLAQIMHGIQMETLLQSTAKTHKQLEAFQTLIESQNVKGLTKESSETARKHMYKNIKELEESANQMPSIEKIRKLSPLKRIVHHFQVKKLNNKVEELETTVKKYEEQFNFNEDEESKFSKYSIESHRPIRKHLVDVGREFIEGAKTLKAEAAKKEMNFKDLSDFQRTLDTWEDRLERDPRVGAGRPDQKLSLNRKQWSKEQQQASKMMREMVDDIVLKYAQLFGKDEKTAREEIIQARDNYLNKNADWKTPIERSIELPAGKRIVNRGKESLEMKHIMTTNNEGYASSLPRNRKAENCIQSNLNQVRIHDREGEISASYLSSATPVEFLLPSGSSERAKATKQNSMELFINGAMIQMDAENLEENSDIDHPKEIHFSAVALLSPDPIREFATQQPQLSKLAEAAGHKIESGNLELQMLQETEGTMRELANGKLGDEFQIAWRDPKMDPDDPNAKKNLNIRVVENQKKEICYEVTDLDRPYDKPIYLTFNLSFFDFGVNKIKKGMLEVESKLHTDILTGNKFENEMNTKAWKHMRGTVDAKLKEIVDERDEINLQEEEVEQINHLLDLEIQVNSARNAFLNAETTYRNGGDKSERDQALAKWSSTKDEFVRELDKAEVNSFSSEMDQYISLTHRIFDIRSLEEEIDDQIIHFKDYRDPKFMSDSAYSLPSAIVTLSTLINTAAWTACRSGKDRTSLQRMEIGVRLGMRKVRGRHLHYLEIKNDPNSYKVRKEMLLNSGQVDEMARRNIGGSGGGLNLSGACARFLKKFFPGGKSIITAFEDSIAGGVYEVFMRKPTKAF